MPEVAHLRSLAHDREELTATAGGSVTSTPSHDSRKAIAERDISLVHRIKDGPLLAPLRSDPRYSELLREMNLAK